MLSAQTAKVPFHLPWPRILEQKAHQIVQSPGANDTVLTLHWCVRRRISNALCVCAPTCVPTLSLFDFLQPHGLQSAKLLCPWDSPGKNTWVSCHFLLQGIFPTWGSNPCLPSLLNWRADSLPRSHEVCVNGLADTCWKIPVFVNRKKWSRQSSLPPPGICLNLFQKPLMKRCFIYSGPTKILLY